MWAFIGRGVAAWDHSSIDGRWDEKIRGRCAASLSHRIKIKYRRATNESIDPYVEIIFHLVYESG